LVNVTFEVLPTSTTQVVPIEFSGQPTAVRVSDANAGALDVVTSNGSVTIIEGTFTGYEADVSPRPSGDNQLSIFDWVQAGRFVSGAEAVTNEFEFQRLDCAPRQSRGDGELTVSDWVQVGRYAVGLDPLTAASGPTEASGGGNVQFQPQADPGRTIRLATVTANSAGSIAMPVSIEGAGTENAVGFSIEFDPARVQFSGVAKLPAFSSSTLLLNTNLIESGRVGVVFALPPGVSLGAGNSTVFQAVFSTASMTMGQTTPIAVNDSLVKREVSSTTGNVLPSTFVGGSISLVAQGPALGILPSGASAVIYWPAPATGFDLYFATSFAGPWQKVSTPPQELGGQKFITVPAGTGSRYFRLQKP
jgi:hypothetical protein